MGFEGHPPRLVRTASPPVAGSRSAIPGQRMRVGSASPATPEPIPALTGIRGIAAVWVLLFHVQDIAESNGFTLGLPGHDLVAAGWSGVDLFFVLSGFMLMHAHGGDTGRTAHGLKSFAVGRFWRIYPLSVAVLLLVTVLVRLDTLFADYYRQLSAGNLSATAFWSTLFLATRWYPFEGNWNQPVWSLSAEMVGYLGFPTVSLAIGRIRSFRLALAVALLAMGSVMAGQAWTGDLGVNVMDGPGALVRMAGYFTAGVALRQAVALYRGTLRGWSVIGIASVACLPVLTSFPQGAGLLPLAFAALIATLYFQTGVVHRWLSSRPALFAGRISFRST